LALQDLAASYSNRSVSRLLQVLQDLLGGHLDVPAWR
jgi:hypothetical protein